MPTVPQYESNVSLRPINQQGVDVNASAEAFGAATGRGLQQLGAGVGQLGDAFTQVQALEDTARAKEADNSYAGWMREAMYGEGGYMTLSGRAAVDGRSKFESEAEAKRREFGATLTGGAATAYSDASQARINSVYQQSIVHSAQERKTWFNEASTARVDTFANDALVNYNKPAQVTKNMAAGILEIREQGALLGWDADTLAARESAFTSGVHKNVTLRLAQDDPLAAEKYMMDHADQMTGANQYELKAALETEINNAKSIQETEAILGLGRQEAAGPAPRIAGETGPTNTRAALYDRLVTKGRTEDVDGLEESFAVNLGAMFQDAPPGMREGLGILSGARSNERQAVLYAEAVRKYGSEAAARKWVAPPGKSNHNGGQAVDISYNGRSLKHAPQEVIDWVHSNAGKYGMHFPMDWENWHIEPNGSRGGAVEATTNQVVPRAVMPSYDDIEARLAGIENPAVRELTRKRLYAQIETQNKAREQQETAAKAELWSYVDKGMTPDQVPMEVRQGAGMAAVSSAWSYLETAAKGRAIESDETLLYDMRRYAASNPTEFAGVDLNNYRDRISLTDIKELTGLQSSALTDERKAREEGLVVTTAYSQATTQLEALGITTTGLDGDRRAEAAARIAAFNNTLAAEMQAFKVDPQNKGRSPNQMEVQSIINRLLLPVVIKQPFVGSDPRGMFATSNDQPALAFEARDRADGTTVDVAIEYGDIPIDLRMGIRRDLELELQRPASEEEIVQRYEDFVLERSNLPTEDQLRSQYRGQLAAPSETDMRGVYTGIIQGNRGR